MSTNSNRGNGPKPFGAGFDEEEILHAMRFWGVSREEAIRILEREEADRD
jgi:hypothetical protein